MSNRICNFSDLIQRVTANCLLHPLASTRHYSTGDDYDSEEDVPGNGGAPHFGVPNEQEQMPFMEQGMEALMNQVFDAISSMKSAYMNLQDAHSPWDPEKMRVADAAVVAELRKLSVLRERFRRSVGNGSSKESRGLTAGTLSEVVAPYEAAVEELKRDVKARDAEVENLKEKLQRLTSMSSTGPKGRSHSKRSIGCFYRQVAETPNPELFKATMSQVKEASKSITSQLLSLMRSARWDIAAAVRSIEAADPTSNAITTSIVSTQHAKYALESYVLHKIFQGFDHESFYMDGSLSSLLNPEQFRRDCFTQYKDMKAMDPVELLGILPTCNFGKFCSNKYLSIFHSKMEESLFGNLEQHNQVLAGNHPRSQFYGQFLGLAKAVWLLHLLAFSLDPAPCQFEASSGAEYDPMYMECVVKFPGGQVPEDHMVGFLVSPGFNLRNGSVVKARVYLIPSSRTEINNRVCVVSSNSKRCSLHLQLQPEFLSSPLSLNA